MKLNIYIETFCKLDNVKRPEEKLRGYIGNKYIDNTIFHNHNNSNFYYRYPLVQYKSFNKKLIVIGINEGANVLKKVLEEEKNINLLADEYNLNFNEKVEACYAFGCVNNLIKYKFITPWIALSQKNIKLYEEANEEEKQELLKRILIGNIISMSKTLGYTVDRELKCEINLVEKRSILKGIKFISFLGTFKINFYIPSYLGLGKSVSKGFGTVKNLLN